MGERLLEFRRLAGGDFQDLPIHPRPHETLLGQPGENFAVFALLGSHQRRQDHQLRAGRVLHHRIDDLRRALAGNRPAAFPAIRRPRPREENAQVIVNLRRRGHDRARIAAGRPLLDGNRRRQPLDLVDIRLLQLVEELPRVRRQRFDIFALPLGIHRIERQRRFPASRQAGDDHDLIARNVHVEILEIVLPRAADADGFETHDRSIVRTLAAMGDGDRPPSRSGAAFLSGILSWRSRITL